MFSGCLLIALSTSSPGIVTAGTVLTIPVSMLADYIFHGTPITGFVALGGALVRNLPWYMLSLVRLNSIAGSCWLCHSLP